MSIQAGRSYHGPCPGDSELRLTTCSACGGTADEWYFPTVDVRVCDCCLCGVVNLLLPHVGIAADACQRWNARANARQARGG